MLENAPHRPPLFFDPLASVLNKAPQETLPLTVFPEDASTNLKETCERMLDKLIEVRSALKTPLSLTQKLLAMRCAAPFEVIDRGLAHVSPHRIVTAGTDAVGMVLALNQAGTETLRFPLTVSSYGAVLRPAQPPKPASSSPYSSPTVRSAASTSSAISTHTHAATDPAAETLLRAAAAKYRGRYFGPQSGEIGEVFTATQALPGHVYLSSNPSITSVGAVASLGLCVRSPYELAEVAVGGTYMLEVPKLMSVHIPVAPRPGWLQGRDIGLYLLRVLTRDGARNAIIEFEGKGAAALTLHDRMRLCDLAREVGAVSAVFPLYQNSFDFGYSNEDAEIDAEFVASQRTQLTDPFRGAGTFRQLHAHRRRLSAYLMPYAKELFTSDPGARAQRAIALEVAPLQYPSAWYAGPGNVHNGVTVGADLVVASSVDAVAKMHKATEDAARTAPPELAARAKLQNTVGASVVALGTADVPAMEQVAASLHTAVTAEGFRIKAPLVIVPTSVEAAVLFTASQASQVFLQAGATITAVGDFPTVTDIVTSVTTKGRSVRPAAEARYVDVNVVLTEVPHWLAHYSSTSTVTHALGPVAASSIKPLTLSDVMPSPSSTSSTATTATATATPSIQEAVLRPYYASPATAVLFAFAGSLHFDPLSHVLIKPIASKTSTLTTTPAGQSSAFSNSSPYAFALAPVAPPESSPSSSLSSSSSPSSKDKSVPVHVPASLSAAPAPSPDSAHMVPFAHVGLPLPRPDVTPLLHENLEGLFQTSMSFAPTSSASAASSLSATSTEDIELPIAEHPLERVMREAEEAAEAAAATAAGEKPAAASATLPSSSSSSSASPSPSSSSGADQDVEFDAPRINTYKPDDPLSKVVQAVLDVASKHEKPRFVKGAQSHLYRPDHGEFVPSDEGSQHQEGENKDVAAKVMRYDGQEGILDVSALFVAGAASEARAPHAAGAPAASSASATTASVAAKFNTVPQSAPSSSTASPSSSSSPASSLSSSLVPGLPPIPWWDRADFFQLPVLRLVGPVTIADIARNPSIYVPPPAVSSATGEQAQSTPVCAISAAAEALFEDAPTPEVRAQFTQLRDANVEWALVADTLNLGVDPRTATEFKGIGHFDWYDNDLRKAVLSPQGRRLPAASLRGRPAGSSESRLGRNDVSPYSITDADAVAAALHLSGCRVVVSAGYDKVFEAALKSRGILPMRASYPDLMAVKTGQRLSVLEILSKLLPDSSPSVYIHSYCGSMSLPSSTTSTTSFSVSSTSASAPVVDGRYEADPAHVKNDRVSADHSMSSVEITWFRCAGSVEANAEYQRRLAEERDLIRRLKDEQHQKIRQYGTEQPASRAAAS